MIKANHGMLCGGMVIAFVPGLSGFKLSPGQGLHVVFLGFLLTLTVPLSQVYKWVLEICWGNLANCGSDL